jgi:uridine monophosphate synthetase
MSSDLTQLVVKLHDIQGVKFGSYKLKSGIISPIYIDLRVLVGHPALLKDIVHAMHDKVKEAGVTFDLICGVPYTALPMSAVISLEHNVPMVMVRKEAKDYGTKQLVCLFFFISKEKVEGSFSAGQKCLVIEDLVTTGGSVLGVAATLKEQNLTVTDFAVFLDREQGGPQNIAQQGYKIHAVITISKLLDILKTAGKITPEKYAYVKAFLICYVLVKYANFWLPLNLHYQHPRLYHPHPNL